MGNTQPQLLSGCCSDNRPRRACESRAEIQETTTWSSPFSETMAGPSPTTVVLVGGTGAGKSNLGNFLLGRNAFVSSNAQKSVTTKATVHEGTWFGGLAQVRVVDCPGIGDTKGKNADREQWDTVIELLKEVGQVHALVLVMRAGRFTKWDRDAVATLRESFGPRFWKNLRVFYTGSTARPGQLDLDAESPRIRAKLSEVEAEFGSSPEALKAIQAMPVYAADLSPALATEETRNEEFRLKRSLKSMGLLDLLALDARVPANVLDLPEAKLEQLMRDPATEKWVDGNYFQLGLSRLLAMKKDVSASKPYTLADLARLAEVEEEEVPSTADTSSLSSSSSFDEETSSMRSRKEKLASLAASMPLQLSALDDSLFVPGPDQFCEKRTSQRMEGGSMVELSPKAGRCSVNLSWRLPMQGVARGAVNATVSALYLGADGQMHEVGVASEGSSLGAGTQVDLSAVPQNVVQVFIIGNITAPASLDWKLLQNLRCCLTNSKGVEIGNHNLNRRLSDGYHGLIVGRLFRVPRLESKWSFQAIGRSVDSGDLEREMFSLSSRAPSELVRAAARPGLKPRGSSPPSSQASTCASTESPPSITPSVGSPRGPAMELPAQP
mmetsp:Transcript_73603/g.157839  ORF Transcript_73603/g.157839 Transcript_73603/m.157839 type:complete len:610 (+) Transcript_73603:111-1940(+)